MCNGSIGRLRKTEESRKDDRPKNEQEQTGENDSKVASEQPAPGCGFNNVLWGGRARGQV